MSYQLKWKSLLDSLCEELQLPEEKLHVSFKIHDTVMGSTKEFTSYKEAERNYLELSKGKRVLTFKATTQPNLKKFTGEDRVFVGLITNDTVDKETPAVWGTTTTEGTVEL